MDNIAFENLTLDLLKALSPHVEGIGYVTRDYELRLEYKKLRNNGICGKAAREILSERFFISVKQVERILYAKQKDYKKDIKFKEFKAIKEKSESIEQIPNCP